VQPAEIADEIVAWPQHEVVRVGEDDLRPASSRSRRVTAFTAAAVPTGMKAGVSMAPCGVVRRPARARPSVASSEKAKDMSRGV